MRIITGTARGAVLNTLEGEATRPTPAKVKEALFSSIQFDIEGRRVLDLFAGSGQLGLEALSRGAEKATFVDGAREATAIITANAQKTHLYKQSNVLCMDWKQYIKSAKGRSRFD
ncbi:MAG: RsmD family RNA methyltransferase, partial [Clostridia bacterium]|nr:RsmD family RNA methyltransferase [Clostridia bacterium]